MKHPSPAEALLAASRALVGVAARSVADIGDVTLPQFRALVLVSSRPRTTVSDLAAAIGIHPTSATRLCDRLVQKGLLRRTEAVDDRRQTDLHLTDRGQRIVDEVTARRRRDLDAIVARMGPAAAQAATEALLAFAEAADDALGHADVFGWDSSSR
ncbi:MAG TPA: MarR family transcriptional regulator [Acidimicrobiales bacterium]|nr:MarR family transcriptional regulator [Acidimicrobiales bacterium]